MTQEQPPPIPVAVRPTVTELTTKRVLVEKEHECTTTGTITGRSSTARKNKE